MKISNPQDMSGRPLLTQVAVSEGISGDGTPENPLTVDISSASIGIDSAITSNGINAVQGKAIYSALSSKADIATVTALSSDVSVLEGTVSSIETSVEGKASAIHSHTMSDITDMGSYVEISAIDSANGVAGLDASGKIVASAIPDLSSTYVATATANTSNGYAKLDADGKVPTSLLPSYVSDVFEGYLISGVFYKTNSSSGEVIDAKSNAIYVDKTTDKTYRWSGSQYTEISKSLALGTTSETAYPGDSGAALASAVSGKADSSHTHTKSDITDFAHTHEMADITGLSAALSGKQNAITSSNKLSWNLISDQPTIPQVTTSLTETGTNGVQASVLYAEFATIKARLNALENPSTTGNLEVVYSGTAPSGAQWSCNGGSTWNNFGATVVLDPGNYTVTYKTVSNYITPDSQSATVSVGSTTTITANSYTQYGTLLVNYTGTAPSGAQWSHNGGSTWTNFGSSVSIVPGTYTVSYKTVNGYTAPSSTSATVTSGNTTTITAGTYTENISTFELIVSGQNLPSGARWSYNGGSTWNNFPGSATLTPGTYTLTFKDVTGYVTPSSQTFTASAGDSISYSDISYTAYGILSVHLNNNAEDEGRWIVNGTEYASDASPFLAPGSYTVTFKEVSGYTTPASQTANVISQQTTQLTAEYVRQSTGGNGYIVINDKQSNGQRSGIYTLVSGTENSSAIYANGGSLWKHQTLPYYLYYAGGGTSYWYISSVPGSTSDDATQVSSAGGNPTSVFLGGATSNNITITYITGTAPSGAHLTVWNTASSHTYTGEYYLYSGTANTTSAVWKKTDGNYYILMNPSGSVGGWTIYNVASTSGTDLVRLSSSTATSAETAFNGGVTSGNYIVFYSDGVAGSASAQYPDSIALTFPESFQDPMYSQTVTIDDAYNGTYAYSGECKLFGYLDMSTYTNKYVARPVYINGTKTLCYGSNPQDAGGFQLHLGVGTMGTTTYLYNSSSTTDSIGVLTGNKNWSYGSATFKVSGVYDSGLTDTGSGAHITMTNGDNAKYDGNWYLTSGAANSTSSVWTHFSGKYTLSYSSYWWIHDGSNTIQATGSGAGVPSSWSAGTSYNNITLTYHAS